MWLRKPAPLSFTNSLSGEKEAFVPLKKGQATLYSCGPTVYGPQHIGNMRAAVFADLVYRTLTHAGYKTKRVINITDVGHMVGDGDEGEDKMAAGARAEQATPEAVAARYTERYLQDISALNLDLATIRFPRATQYIKEQIQMISALERKGFTYQTSDGVYFATEKFPDYGVLGNVRNVEQRAGARVEVGQKKSPQDFVLWRAAKPNDLQQWDSPWGKGNPGWSIECSAMITKLLGERIDVHTGGEEHVAVHHNNEIAQSECASGKSPFVRYWLHGAFLTLGGEKISKSLGNTYTLSDITARNLHPLSLRYFFLQAHYRSPLSFSFEALSAASEALQRLWRASRGLLAEGTSREDSPARAKIRAALFDDLGTPQALAHLWEGLSNSELTAAQKRGLLAEADSVLGLSLMAPPGLLDVLTLDQLPSEARSLAREREDARNRRDFARADELRIHLRNGGYAVEDTPSGPLFTRIESE